MEERKIWASAFLLIDRNGDDAADHALKQANVLLESGDAKDEARASGWRRSRR